MLCELSQYVADVFSSPLLGEIVGIEAAIMLIMV